MKIGNVEIENNIFLAPMAGVTDVTFRAICKEFGAGLTYSEMVSAKGLYYKDKKTASLMKKADNETPYAIQIFGSEPEIMAEIAPQVAEFGADIIDINMGCPTPKIVNNGDGSALMKNPELAGRVVRAVSDAVKQPVTVKIRAGWDSVSAVEFAKVLEANGASAIAVHGRTREQFYRGVADWGIIAAVKKNVKVPVIGNGDIFTAADAERMFKETGCDAVMIGRGCQGNPFIFKEISELLQRGEVTYQPGVRERLELALEHTHRLVADKGEFRGIKEARKHIAWYIKGMQGSAAMKNIVFKADTLAEIDELFSDSLQKLQ